MGSTLLRWGRSLLAYAIAVIIVILVLALLLRIT